MTIMDKFLVDVPDHVIEELVFLSTYRGHILEIGSGWGYSTLAFLQHNDLVITVDVDLHPMHGIFDNRVGNDPRCIRIVGNSNLILPLMRDKYFDIIYIDGDHDNAYNDAMQSLPLLKPHGTLLFDDYNHPEHWHVHTDVDKFQQEHPEFSGTVHNYAFGLYEMRRE